jgi:hypothetical protein
MGTRSMAGGLAKMTYKLDFTAMTVGKRKA